MKWVKLQNTFSIENCEKYFVSRYYYYYKKHERKRYKMGAYRYSVNCSIFSKYIGKTMDENGIYMDGVAYFWHFFHSSCSFEKDKDLYYFLKKAYIVNKIKKGQWIFPYQLYSNIFNYIKDLNHIIKPTQKFIVYLPKNKFIEKESERQYQSYFIDFLKKERITYVIGDINNIKIDNKQVAIFVLDLITDHERLKYIINTIRTNKHLNQPVISFFSFMKILNREECHYALEIKKIVKAKNENRPTFTHTVRTPDYDEEDLIMKSLMGHGPDPEIFGF